MIRTQSEELRILTAAFDVLCTQSNQAYDRMRNALLLVAANCLTTVDDLVQRTLALLKDDAVATA